MHLVRKLPLTVMSGVLLLLSTSCQEDELTSDLHKTSIPPRERPSDVTDQPNPDRLPYPTIIKQIFVPEYGHFDEEKCIAWRIEWPEYSGSTDPYRIPSFFATSNDALNSFDYLQSIHPSNKEKLNFSLYLDDKLEAVTNISYLWKLGEGLGVQNVTFQQLPLPSDIEDWVTERPGLFESYWDEGENMGYEAEYEEGDFFLYKLHTDGLYGGIRIVSEEPRIVEVYLAVPNTGNATPEIRTELSN